MRASLLAVTLLTLAAPAFAQNGLLPAPQPERITLSNGRTWERIRLQHMDVRVLTALTGSPNLVSEYDLYRMRMGGGGMPVGGGYAGYGGMPMGGGYAGYGGVPMGGGYGAAGFGGAAGMAGAFGGGPFGGRAILGDPGSNSLLVGPGGVGRGGFAGPGGGGRAGGANPLFPGLIILGDPNTNSLIVDP